jgi:phospholipid/cholesterol/gamma-HCH transport system permease protein
VRALVRGIVPTLVQRSFLGIGRYAAFLYDTGRSVRDIRIWLPLTATQMRRVGVQSLPIALFIATFTGIVLALLSSYIFTGAAPVYFVGTFVGKAMMLELAPVLVGLALAGRVGANIAAELGTMRVTEQVDALETLAYSPHAYLVVPRVIAASLMFPVVVALATVVGIVAGWFTGINLLDLSTPQFVQGLRLFYQAKDVWFGLVKAMSFGFAVASIGCLKGLRTTGGAEGVGRETTAAVVLGAESILVLDAFWAVVLL